MTVCEVCGLPAERHTIEIRGGVAHAVVPDRSSCSGIAGDREYIRGRLAQMLTIIRSLRYIAGRDQIAELREYSDIVVDQRDKLIRQAQRGFPWGTL